jgi:hypothetical protein
MGEAKQEYIAQLDDMRAKLQRLRDTLDNLVGDGFISDNVNWGHVGDLKRANALLDEALRVNLKRVR